MKPALASFTLLAACGILGVIALPFVLVGTILNIPGGICKVTGAPCQPREL